MTAHVESMMEKRGHGELGSIGLFWTLILELTGVMERHCRKHHHRYQEVRQVQYDGASIVYCSKCYRTFWKQ